MQSEIVEGPIAIDLSRLAERLNTESRLPGLIQSVNRARRIASCIVDLEHATDACNIISNLEKLSLSESNVSLIRQALLYSALSLYVRATITAAKNGERGSFEPQLDPHHYVMHEKIKDIRNTALAHVNLDMVDSGMQWHSACLAFVTNGKREGFFTIAASTNYDTEAFDILQELIPIAREQLMMKQDEAKTKAISMLIEAGGGMLNADTDVDSLDLVRHFGSKEEGISYLELLLK